MAAGGREGQGSGSQGGRFRGGDLGHSRLAHFTAASAEDHGRGMHTYANGDVIPRKSLPDNNPGGSEETWRVDLGKGKWQEVKDVYWCSLCDKHLNEGMRWAGVLP